MLIKGVNLQLSAKEFTFLSKYFKKYYTWKVSSYYKICRLHIICQLKTNIIYLKNNSLINCFSCQKFKQIPYHWNYYYCTSTGYENINIYDHEEWKIFYKFPYIVHARLVNRLKLYQTCFTVSVLPIAAVFYHKNLISLTVLKYFSGVSILACTMLCIMGYYFGRLIGSMYIHKKENILKVSHLTFWGRRKDFLLPTSLIIPLMETSSKKHDAFLKLANYNSSEIMYFSVKYGKIIDDDIFYHVFGSIENL